MDTNPTAVIEPPASVLHVHAGQDEPNARDCLDHETEATATLEVSFATDDPARPEPDGVDHAGLVVVGDVLLESRVESPEAFDEPVVVDSVRDPTDLSAIGATVSRFCEQWADQQLAVCFDSLDALLRHTPPWAVFAFVHLLLDRVSSVDAAAHVHFDSTRHEDPVVSAFGTLFDAVVVDESHVEPTEATDEEIAQVLGK